MDRRTFLAALPALPAAVAARADAPPAGRPTRPATCRATGADLGSLFPPTSSGSPRPTATPSFPAPRSAPTTSTGPPRGRRCSSCSRYRPAEVDPRPEVVERIDRGDHVREKVVFSTDAARSACRPTCSSRRG